MSTSIKDKSQMLLLKKLNEQYSHKIYVSMTTIPPRSLLIQPVIDSILNQDIGFHTIIINFQKKSGRFEKSCEFSSEIKNNSNIILNEVNNDFGPLNKIVPTLSLLDQDSFVITIDDDIIYPRNMLYHFLINHLNLSLKYKNKVVVGASGLSFGAYFTVLSPIYNSWVTVLEGMGGVLYKREYFKDDFLDYIDQLVENKHTKYSDDIVIHNYLSKHQVSKFVINNENFSKNKFINLTFGLDNMALRSPHNDLGMDNITRYYHAIQFLKDQNLLYLQNDYYEKCYQII